MTVTVLNRTVKVRNRRSLSYSVRGQQPNVIEKLFGDDEAHTPGRSAAARVVPVLFEIVAVVEADFLARLYGTDGHNPNVLIN